jgi:hypothetical protein
VDSDHLSHELGSRLEGAVYDQVVSIEGGRGILYSPEEEGSSAFRGVARVPEE